MLYVPLLVEPASKAHVFSPQYTPRDSLVFGGNFLHSWNIATRKRLVGCHHHSKLNLLFAR